MSAKKTQTSIQWPLWMGEKQKTAEQLAPPFSGLAVAMRAASAGAAVAAAGVFSLLVLADQIANNEKDYSK